MSVASGRPGPSATDQALEWSGLVSRPCARTLSDLCGRGAAACQCGAAACVALLRAWRCRVRGAAACVCVPRRNSHVALTRTTSRLSTAVKIALPGDTDCNHCDPDCNQLWSCRGTWRSLQARWGRHTHLGPMHIPIISPMVHVSRAAPLALLAQLLSFVAPPHHCLRLFGVEAGRDVECDELGEVDDAVACQSRQRTATHGSARQRTAAHGSARQRTGGPRP